MIGIVGHVSRLQAAQDLAGRTGAAYCSIDNGTLGCNGNHLKVWAHLAEHCTTEWAVVLEDDAIPCSDFRDQLKQALDVAPAPIVGLYLGTGHPHTKQRAIAKAITTAQAHDTCWITNATHLHGVAIAIHTHLINDMLTHTARSPWEMDLAITQWARRRHHQIAFCTPSLVNHTDGPTLTTHRRPTSNPRHAWWAGARTHWTTTTTEM